MYVDGINRPGAADFHTDTRNRPTSYIDTGEEPPFTGSHELAEMLVDPSGTVSTRPVAESRGQRQAGRDPG
jgi:hypothetical protein